MMRDRAFRRAQLERKKTRVRQYWAAKWSSSPRVIGLVATTPKGCACDMCQGPKYRDEVPVSARRRMAA